MARPASCWKCKGYGKVYPISKKTGRQLEFTCEKCGGSGIDRDKLTKSCEKCSIDITFPANAQYEPKYCKTCKEIVNREKEAKWREKRCTGCGATIKYNVDWAKVPDLCQSCKERERAKWKESRCTGCGATIKYNTDWGRVPDLCKPCIEKKKREREAAQAKWKEKSCSKCGATIKYNVDWAKVPDLCKDCVQKERDKWEERQCKNCSTTFKVNKDWDKKPELCKTCIQKEREKWVDKTCEKCHKSFKVNKDWDNPPKICKDCREKQPKEREERIRKAERNSGTYRETALKKADQFIEREIVAEAGPAQTWGQRISQSTDFDTDVRVKSGWSYDRDMVTTDILIFIKDKRYKKIEKFRKGHYHLVLDENGNILIDEWRDKW